MTWLLSLLSSLLLLPALGTPSPAERPELITVEADADGRIEIVARGMHNDVGRMMALLYDSDDGFPRDLDKCSDYRTADISNGRARTSFSRLEPGTYAILVIHDEDRDGYLKTNLLGMPKEGVGVSNNGGGIPKFKKAKFELGASATVTKTININYL